MIILGIILVLSLGLSVINYISKDFSILEKIGLAFLIGIGFETIFMFIYDILNMKFNVIMLCIISILFIIILNIRNIKNFRVIFKKLKKNKPQFPKINYKKINLVWLFFFILICVLIYGSAAKSLYWPTFAYDNVAGYDLMGKVVASEGKINNSLFEINNTPILGSARRCIYPPLVSGSFALAYLCNLPTSKLISTLFFIFFVISFYASLRLFTNKTNSIIITFFTVITPEMFAFSSLSTTNIPIAIYGSLSIIYLYIWLNRREQRYLLIASLLMGFNIWTRSDAVVFNVAGFIVLLFDALKNRNWKELLIYSIIAFLPFIAWNLYIKFNINVDQNVFINKPFWDSNKFNGVLTWVKNLVTNTNLYGISFYAFFVSIIINIKNIFKEKTSILLILFFISWGIYTLLFYQMDNTKMDSLATMMKASYRRGLFAFIPIMWFYVSTNKTINFLSNKYEKILFPK